MLPSLSGPSRGYFATRHFRTRGRESLQDASADNETGSSDYEEKPAPKDREKRVEMSPQAMSPEQLNADDLMNRNTNKI